MTGLVQRSEAAYGIPSFSSSAGEIVMALDSLDITALLSSQVIEELASQALAVDHRNQGGKKSSVPPLKRADRSKDTPRRVAGSPGSPPPLVPSQRLTSRPAAADARRAPSQPSQLAVSNSVPKAENLSPEFGRSLPQGTYATSPDVEKTSVEAKKPATTPRTRRKKDEAQEPAETEKPGQKKALSSKEVQHFANRMSAWAKDRDKRRQDESEKARSKETIQQLQISERSRKLAKHVKPVHERLGDIVQGRKEAFAQAKAKQEEMEMKDATMHPVISARAQKMERRFEDHQSWKERRDKRIGEEQLAQYQKQLAECTFKPQINKTSSSLAQKTSAISFRHGRRPGAGGEAGAQMPDDEEHELPFRVATDCSGMETPIMALNRLQVDFEHVFSCDTCPQVKKQILANFPQVKFFDDLMARDNSSRDVPAADLYIAGFPCQPFSGAGKGLGLEDTRGTVFFG
eukprot:s592_g13.t1